MPSRRDVQHFSSQPFKDKQNEKPRRYTLKICLVLIVLTVLPIASGLNIWREIWAGKSSHAWDGAGHQAVAYIFDKEIFPDALGWTDAYFGGMPFPNFYPHVYYWCIALLHHTHIFSFEAAFKFVTALPILLIPAMMWLLGRAVSDRDHLTVTCVSLASLPLLTDGRFQLALPAGLDYYSTFQIGLYTQPLGFVLLVAWYVAFLRSGEGIRKFSAASILLTLTLLANFFNAVTAAVIIVSTLAQDLYLLRHADDAQSRNRIRKDLISHLSSSAAALVMAAFWLVPVLGQYKYFVTRPFTVETGMMLTSGIVLWYALAAAGGLVWLRRPTRAAQPYLVTCLLLGAAVLLGATLAPSWFPLQSPRFLATLNFLLAVPVGYALAAGLRGFARVLGETSAKDRTFTFARARYTAVTASVLFLLLLLTASGSHGDRTGVFYPAGQKTNIDDVLDFARQHRDGRYLVEVINPQVNAAYTEASFDARALNSYLGAQGNETLAAVFHEASPNSLFMLPAVDALSIYPDSFGISSALADDLDFAAQPLPKHVERARLLGVKYIVSRTPAMKEKLAREPSVGARHDFGWWSVFELRDEPPPRAYVLPYRPALVLSPLTLKLRRSNEWSFTRLAEEQFADGWFDVLLALSTEKKIDRLRDLDRFGALVIDAYNYDDEGRAYEILKQFAQGRELVLLSGDSQLFRRISSSRAEFPKLDIIERGDTGPGDPMEALQPTHHYKDNPVRKAWGEIRLALDKSKLPVAGAGAEVPVQLAQNKMSLGDRPVDSDSHAPILISSTFHPNWRREDGKEVYAATPFYTLTFADGPVTLIYSRTLYETAAVWASATALALVCLLSMWTYVREQKAG